MIEVLVALAIIGVALAASMRAVGAMANGEADLHRRLLAGWSADNERSCVLRAPGRTLARAPSTARKAT
jgi:type II secretion system protein I